MLDDNNWMKWYNRLTEDRIRRSLGLLRRDEGTMAPEDKVQLMLDRGEGPQDPITEDSIRNRMSLPRKEENKK